MLEREGEREGGREGRREGRREGDRSEDTKNVQVYTCMYDKRGVPASTSDSLG